MAKRKFDNDFKVMILDLLKSGIKSSQLSEDYQLTQSMINRWKREYASKLGDFSKKKEVSPAEEELKALKKELRDVTMERDILKKVVSIFSKNDN